LNLLLSLSLLLSAAAVCAQSTNPLWHEQKIKNYLPDMTWPEVQELLTKSDMVIIPVGALEEHGPQGPVGTDFYNGNEEAQLIAQKTDVLVAPILMPGNSPYHMGFPCTISCQRRLLSASTSKRSKAFFMRAFDGSYC
jgi:creatinine amidohydrolase